jgi:hypothetical protein
MARDRSPEGLVAITIERDGQDAELIVSDQFRLLADTVGGACAGPTGGDNRG